MLLFSIVINYQFAISISYAKNAKYNFLIIGIFFNLILLFWFKYSIFFLEEIVNPFIKILNINPRPLPQIILPLALSFYTFHALSYLIDVYKKKVPAEKNIINLGLYFLLFPHLVAGPIVRFGEIMSDLKNRQQTLSNFSYGISRFIIGLSKKVLIADILSGITDEIFAIPPQNMTWETAWLGLICFTLQIYFDFSGYSDMAIGIASMLGFKFPENFNYPYISGSIREFWQRWHITLYRWFRDYVYIPLGGNRVSEMRYALNILFVFALTGLWHGAAWHYIIWGLLQGVFILLERFKERVAKDFLSPFKHLYALFAIFVSWVFFRSEDTTYAISFLKRLFIDFSSPHPQFRSFSFFIDNERQLAIVLGIIFSTPIFKIIYEKILIKYLNNQKINFSFQNVKIAYLTCLLILSILYIANQTYNPFLYFKF